MNLSEINISNEISFVLENGESTVSSSSQNRNKQQLLEHIYNGIDVILITSSRPETGSLFLQQCFNDDSDQIRTIFLNSESFPKDDLATTNPAHDLSMISAVVYESIHLDTHFAIVVADADQLPLQILNELIKLALAINSSKNNVNFIFSGGPNLLSVVQQISEINRLGLAHCSLDEITEEDVEIYIDEKQSECVESKKLKFNKYALKKISTHANGSLLKASMLLEWCREYAIYTGNFKVTVGSIDQILSNHDCGHLLSNYPAADFTFTASVSDRSRDENVEFSKQDVIPSKQAPIEAAVKTVYIDEINTLDKKESKQENVYEKILAATPNDIESINSSEIMNITLSSNDGPSEVITEKNAHDELDYQDTYRLEALADINKPLSPTYGDFTSYTDEDKSSVPALLTKTSNNASKSALIWAFFILSIIVGLYSLFVTDIISYNDVRTYFATITSSNSNKELVVPSEATSNSILEVISSTPNSDNKNLQDIAELLELAASQISKKKLSTPPSDNALETYRMVLTLHPSNKKALAGIDLIKERYRTWAELDIKDGNSKRAIYFLQRAIEISPDEEVLNLLADLQ